MQIKLAHKFNHLFGPVPLPLRYKLPDKSTMRNLTQGKLKMLNLYIMYILKKKKKKICNLPVLLSIFKGPKSVAS